MKRVLLKLSGEALAGDKKTGFDEATCIGVAKQVKRLTDPEFCKHLNKKCSENRLNRGVQSIL